MTGLRPRDAAADAAEDAPPDRPRLRPLDVQRALRAGEPALALRDPLELAEGTLVLPEVLAPILALLDGTRDRPTILAELRLRHGLRAEPAQLDGLLDALDAACLLDNERAAAARAARLAAFRAADARPPSHAGAVYPEDPRALAAQLDGWLAGAARRGIEPLEAPRFPFGLLSPHIDYGRGGPVYAAVWRRAARAVAEADLAVILATDHGGDAGTVTLTRQSYATPLGRLPTETGVVDALAAAWGEEAAFDGELRHASEHSIELLAVWLQHLRGPEPLPLVPVLVGGFGHFRADPGEPARDPALAALLAALDRATAGRKVLVAASGDLAHVGPAFGGPPWSADDFEGLQEIDAALLERMEAGDAEGFFAGIQAVENAHNVCGVAPIWLTMKASRAGGGRTLDYAQCPADAQDRSRVSIGGLVFEPERRSA